MPLYKRGNTEKAGNYRIWLLCTAYKIYAEVIRDRIEKEVEEKNIVLRQVKRVLEEEDQRLIISLY